MFGLMGVARMSGQPGGAFSPLSLFAASEQGAWYDPSDFASMFQDAAGTTPVTAVEQPVGKINDKSGNGYHATQPTAAARPVVSARVNLHTQTEIMTVANGWIAGGSVVVSDPGVPPGSSATASSQITADNQYEGPYQAVLAVGVTYTKSVWLKGAVGGEVVGITDNGNTGGTVTVTSEWAQYTKTWTTVDSASSILISSVGGGVVYAADVQVELGTTATRYQRVTTASDYDTVGFPLYLSHDGIDDSLSTTFPDLGTDVTIARAVPMVGASILTAQTIGAGTWTDSTNHAGLVIIDRALTAGETAALTAYLDAKAGV